ncbi:MAG: hypothetical protein ACT4PL_01595, partial [Phycisphaerales bacterium]
MLTRFSAFVWWMLALLVAVGLLGDRALAQSNCITGAFAPPDSNFDRNGSGILRVLGGPGGDHVLGLMIDQTGDGIPDLEFGLPLAGQDAVNYFLSPGQGFVVAIGCPNVQGCPSVGGPGAQPARTIALMRVPSAGSVLSLVHTDCLGGGLLNGNGRWYERGLCHPAAPGLACGATADYALGATVCNAVYIARSDVMGNNELRIYDLGNTTPDPTDGRGQQTLDAGIEDTTMALDRGGNVLMVKSGLVTQGNRFNVNLIDLCPGSATFGRRIVGGGAPYVNISTASGLLSANVTLCSASTLTVQPRVASTNLGPALVINRCCAGAAEQMGRCCNRNTGGCSPTTLAGCDSVTSTFTAGANCGTPCPQPTPVLDVVGTGPSMALVGQGLTYTLVCSNTGPIAALNTTVRLTFSTSFATIESVSGGGVVTGGQVRWTLGTLAASAESGPLSITLRPVCLAVLQPFALSVQATTSNGPTAVIDPPFTVTTTSGPTDAVATTVVSTPATGEPLTPGTLITHTVTMTNTLNAVRYRTGFTLSAGHSASFQSVLTDGGGTITLQPGSGNMSWAGDLAPSSVTVVSFTSKIFDCLPVGARPNQLGFGGSTFITDGCGNALALVAPGPMFAVEPPLTAGLRVVDVPGVCRGGSGVPSNGNRVALVRRGQPGRFALELRNLAATAQPGARATVTFDSNLEVNDPPYAGTPAGVSYDAETRVLILAADLAVGGVVSVEFEARLATQVRCSGTLAVTAGGGLCSSPAGSLGVFAVAEPPGAPHLLAQDYIDGLLTFRPDIDTELQPLLCFNFSGSGSAGLSRSPAGDVYMASPLVRLNPSTLELVDYPASDFPVLDVAFDSTTGTSIRLGDQRIARHNEGAGTSTLIVQDPTRFFRQVVVGRDGRIATIAS